MSVSASDGAEKLSALAEELSGNDPELGAQGSVQRMGDHIALANRSFWLARG